mgnify:FL=1
MRVWLWGHDRKTGDEMYFSTAGERLLAEIPLVAPEAVPARTFPELWAEFLKSICLSA